MLYPAMCDGVVAVSATDGQDALASFSARGSRIDISAPGVDIVSSLTKEPTGEYFGLYSGTSMSAPFVAGTLALQLATTPFLWDLSATDLGLPASQQGRLGLVQVPASIQH